MTARADCRKRPSDRAARSDERRRHTRSMSRSEERVRPEMPGDRRYTPWAHEKCRLGLHCQRPVEERPCADSTDFTPARPRRSSAPWCARRTLCWPRAGPTSGAWPTPTVGASASTATGHRRSRSATPRPSRISASAKPLSRCTPRRSSPTCVGRRWAPASGPTPTRSRSASGPSPTTAR